MTKHKTLTARFFDGVILERPFLIIVCLLAVICFLGDKARDFKLDASAETLVLENDEDLLYSRMINNRYGTEDFVLLTYAPKDDLFSDKVLEKISRLRDDLLKLECVSSINTILDVPLLESPPVPIKELASNVRTLESPGVDKELARIEFKNSPLYQKILVSPDLKITGLQVVFKPDEKYRILLDRRNELREKQTDGSLTESEALEYKQVSEYFQQHRDEMRNIRHRNIADIRSIMDRYRDDAELFLGGVSMIADDLITFIKSDLKIFGIGVLFFLIVTLSIIFRQIRWVLLPVLCCGFSVIAMVGLLGLFGWEVTVISSNFISLQLIITMAITIHLIVRYRELHRENPDEEHRKLVGDSVSLMIKPCMYAALTTIAGFGSLLLCNILPVITFGWMMIAGIIVSLIVTFILFPSFLMVMGRISVREQKTPRFSLPSFFARYTESHGKLILFISMVAFILSIIGITRLVVENSFIDYFKHSTEIYQGMKVIDQNLGGTTPLDVIVELDNARPVPPPVENEEKDNEDLDMFDEFDEFDNDEDDAKYWFTSDKMARIVEIHDYLDSIPETGKVLSLGTMMKITEAFNKGKPLDNFKLALLYSELPEKFRGLVLKPYVSVEHSQVRFSIRVRDSEKTLKRDLLLKKIQNDLVSKLGLKEKNVHLTGMLVLYNNMLQSLFDSQIKTLGVVIFALMVMFLILFRSIKISLIAITPNLLSIGVVLGFMGWMKIPLDMMTITIAAISVGIAVDDTIHYIHRFIREFKNNRNYFKTMHICHGSIGNAMYYTSITIMIGFSILAMSNFIPSIYFGLLTGLAMLIALVAALTLLPQLIIFFKPLGPEGEN